MILLTAAKNTVCATRVVHHAPLFVIFDLLSHVTKWKGRGTIKVLYTSTVSRIAGSCKTKQKGKLVK